MSNGNFKVGDIVVGNKKANKYGFTVEGWVGTVKGANGNTISIHGNGCVGDHGVTVDADCFDLKDSTQHITIRQKGRKMTAVLTDATGRYLKSAKARCNPEDEFNFEIGERLAVSRLLGITVDGNGVEKVVESALAIRIVKQDKYEVGDKVKIRSDLVGDTKYDGLTFNPDMMKYAGVIDSISSIRHDGKYYLSDSSKPGWIYNEAMFEGKVVEGAQPVVPLFDWSAFKAGKFAVHCDTEEKAREFLKECDAHGIKWCGGNKPSEWNGWKRCFSNEILFFP